jgi:hypothetical protein
LNPVLDLKTTEVKFSSYLYPSGRNGVKTSNYSRVQYNTCEVGACIRSCRNREKLIHGLGEEVTFVLSMERLIGVSQEGSVGMRVCYKVRAEQAQRRTRG